jgi:hypothetical protein
MKLRIQSVLQERQERASVDEFAVALVVFFVELDGRCYAGCTRVKQTVGASYATAPLEVGPPEAYQGPAFDYLRFRDLIEQFYRKAIASFPDVPSYHCNVWHEAGAIDDL